MKNWAHCKLSSFFRFTKIVTMKKKQQERRKEGSGRDKIEREKGGFEKKFREIEMTED